MAAHAGSKKVIYAALAGNLLIAVTKFGAAALHRQLGDAVRKACTRWSTPATASCCSTACTAPAGRADRTPSARPWPRALFLELHRRAAGVRARRRRVVLRRHHAHHGAGAGRERRWSTTSCSASPSCSRAAPGWWRCKRIPRGQGRARLSRGRAAGARIRASSPCCSRTAPRCSAC